MAQKNAYDIVLNNNQATVENKSSQADYINLNCYITRPGDEKPEWLFRASCVPTTRKATESVLKKVAEELHGKNVEFTFIEGNMKKEKEEVEELF